MVCVYVKQKTAYELLISDWSSDVCSSEHSPSSDSPRKPLFGRFAHGVVGMLGPVLVILSVIDPFHGDAALDRADMHTQIAAHAFLVDHRSESTSLKPRHTLATRMPSLA